MPIEIVPSIDLRGGKVVRLQQGDYGRQIDYALDPIAVARSFAEAGATWMHVVDLDGAKEGQPVQSDLIATMIHATGLKVQVGGGVRTSDDVIHLLASGAQRVVVGTRAMEDWDWFQALVHSRGMHERIVLALDARDGMVATRGWTQTSAKKAVDVADLVSFWPLAAILYTDVAKDGMMQGPNYAATRAIAKAGKVPVIASGGVGKIDHVALLMELPIWGAIVGRSLYEGTLDLKQAITMTQQG